MMSLSFVFFNDTATTEIYTLSLHDALPIFADVQGGTEVAAQDGEVVQEVVLEALAARDLADEQEVARSEEHTSELQSRQYLVCRLLLEKKYNRNHPVEGTTG